MRRVLAIVLVGGFSLLACTSKTPEQRYSERMSSLTKKIERLQEQMAKRHGFVMTSHRLLMYGTCKECRRSARE